MRTRELYYYNILNDKLTNTNVHFIMISIKKKKYLILYQTRDILYIDTREKYLKYFFKSI